MSATIREELHQQIDRLPDHIVEKIAKEILKIIEALPKKIAIKQN